MRFFHRKPEWRRRTRGFTLVEIMIVVTIIGLLVALGVPVWAKSRRNTQNTAFINDLRVVLHAAQTCLMEKGAWPAEVGASVVPPELAPYVNNATWVNINSVGGRWDWDAGQNGNVAAISVASPSVGDAQMMEIDTKIDDGNLTTGQFRKYGSSFTYILE